MSLGFEDTLLMLKGSKTSYGPELGKDVSFSFIIYNLC
jgi:hypothetical protein